MIGFAPDFYQIRKEIRVFQELLAFIFGDFMNFGKCKLPPPARYNPFLQTLSQNFLRDHEVRRLAHIVEAANAESFLRI